MGTTKGRGLTKKTTALNECKNSAAAGDATTCPQCGRSFKSAKAMFGHMRCHPLHLRSVSFKKPTTTTSGVRTIDRGLAFHASDDEKEACSALLLLSGLGLPSVCEGFDGGSWGAKRCRSPRSALPYSRSGSDSVGVSPPLMASESNQSLDFSSLQSDDSVVCLGGDGVWNRIFSKPSDLIDVERSSSPCSTPDSGMNFELDPRLLL